MTQISRFLFSGFLLLLVAAFGAIYSTEASIGNLANFSNTISDSGPGQASNHTFKFDVLVDVSPGGYFEVAPPSDFTVLATSTFSVRNVELLVNGVPRTATTTAAPGIDQVDIFPGAPGVIRYTLAPDFGITAGDTLELRIGNHTTNAQVDGFAFSILTGTTTEAIDVEPIINSTSLGMQRIPLYIYDGGRIAGTGFVISLQRKIRINLDNTEDIPPFRFNPTPTSTLSGVSLSVEITLETDERADCRWSSVPSTTFSAMVNEFDNTGLIFHSTVVPIVPNSVQAYYIRCRDDEGNTNIDDFVISFAVENEPTGSSNEEGEEQGDGGGTGNDGSDGGDGEGDLGGEGDGDNSDEGTSGNSGGGGGGGGGGSGTRDDGDSSGGGFETTDAPFQSGDGRVIISGRAFPDSEIFFLVDGNPAGTAETNGDGVYSVTLDEIARGAYTFGIFAEDPNGTQSSTFNTSFSVTGARTSSLGNINIAPSILVTPDPADPGETITFSGYALPDSLVTLENGVLNGVDTTILTAVADGNGEWSTTFDTTGVTQGTYQIQAKSEQDGGAETNFSDYTFYGIGQQADVPLNTDLNRDGFVNLIDFSILLFWWASDGGDSDPPADINQDNNVNLTDFSILLFNWTG